MRNNILSLIPSTFKKGILFSSMCLCMGGFSSCTENYNDAWIKEAIEDLNNRVSALEEWCKTANSNISSLQALISAMEQNDYITSVTPVTENGVEIGYTITFKHSPAIIIYHGNDGADGKNGADGKDGYIPTIGVAQAENGLYYWTLDGEWLTDAEGNKICASGKDGADGESSSGMPKLKIQGGYWYVSYDDGATWERLGRATGYDGQDGAQGPAGPAGPAGNSIYDSIDYSNPDYILITLKDGTVIKIARELIINVKTAGTLASELEKAGVDTDTVEELTIIGTLGDDDFETLRDLPALKELDIENVDNTSIPTHAFDITPEFDNYGNIDKINSTLESIILPKGLTKIEDWAFAYTPLKSIEIPSTVISIGNAAFLGCINLSNIELPNSVTQIGEAVFYMCSSLESAQLSNNITEIPKLLFAYCYNLEAVNLPDNITSIGDDAFVTCPLQMTDGKLIIPSKVTTIGTRAFSAYSTNITSISFPEGLKEIKQDAFASTDGVTSVVLPASLETMCDSVFSDKLTSITFKSTTPPQITYTYDPYGNLQAAETSYMQSCNVYVPATAIDTYKASVWFTGTDVYGSQKIISAKQI